MRIRTDSHILEEMMHPGNQCRTDGEILKRRLFGYHFEYSTRFLGQETIEGLMIVCWIGDEKKVGRGPPFEEMMHPGNESKYILSRDLFRPLTKMSLGRIEPAGKTTPDRFFLWFVGSVFDFWASFWGMF
jgi:hypothetical protein